MISHPQLFIRLTAGSVRSNLVHGEAGEYCGGPETLLHWLETQLGLPLARAPHASRVSEFAAALNAANEFVLLRLPAHLRNRGDDMSNTLELVRAGAGSGKTRDLCHTVAEAVAKQLDPARILATTFTKKAAAELKGRILAMLLDGTTEVEGNLATTPKGETGAAGDVGFTTSPDARKPG